ncbi:hypothetical protein HJC23_007847 [Cyclotella cryptica]|uniref:Uncharacterized protein n=1 Tax=Cyclotella cryptica TaxID=29204 RepID=A0ABD3R6I7_9STRA|eukprot:CCRYP_000158-RA/>CCRYP_000158-RA protein AED:0.46 eAED:0.46 QI:0/-1/0/1/-1/1/1/0/173
MSDSGASSTPMYLGAMSRTPEHAPSSTKLSPPPLKQYRLPRRIAPPFNDSVKCDGELNSSSLISILHGQDITTPTSSIASNLESSFNSPEGEDSQDSNANAAMEENLTDFEVAMFSSKSRVFSNHKDAIVGDASASERSRPFFPRQKEFVASPTVRSRFTLTPKIKLFEDRKY